MLQFSNIPEIDFSKGIDQNSSASAIPQGFCEDIINMDIQGKSLAKRKGWEKLAGDVPVNVERIKVDAGDATLTLPTNIDLDAILDSSPLWLFGRINTSGSTYKDIDFRASGFTSLSSFRLSAGGGTLSLDLTEDIGAADYKTILQTINYGTGEIVFVEELQLNPATGALSIPYYTSINIDVQFITHVCTETYTSDDFSSPSALSMDTATSLPASTHGLSNLIIPMFWEMQDATTYKSCLPESFIIAPNGDLSIEFAPEVSGKLFQVFLTACEDYLDGTASPGGASTEVSIPNAQNKYLVAACYTEDGVTGDMSLVLPESIIYDAENSRHLITFTHGLSSDFTNYRIVYAYGRVASNRLFIGALTDTSGATVDTSDLEVPATLMLTGLNNELLAAPPLVNYLDNYEEDAETLCAAGGNLLRTYDPNINESYDARSRLSADISIGPTFTAVSYGRTAGELVTATSSASGYLKVLSILPLGSNLFSALISAPSYSLVGAASLASLIPEDTSVLTIAGSTKAKFNGDFLIREVNAVDADSFSVTIEVEGGGVRDKDIESGARCAIFSDTLTFQAEALFSPEDTLTLSDSSDCEVLAVNSITPTTVYIKSAEEKISLFQGQRLGVSALRTSVITPSLTSLVAGDIVTINGSTTRITSVVDLISSSVITFREAVQINLSQYTIVCPLRWQVILPSDAFLGNKTVSEDLKIRSIAGKRNMYFSSGIKYDGDKIYTSGVPKLQMHNAINIEENVGGIAVSTKSVDIVTITSGGDATVSSLQIGILSIGDYVCLRDTVTSGSTTTCNGNNVYVVDKIDTENNIIKFDIPIPASVEGHTYILSTFVTYRYFLRLALLDRNGNLAVSASLGSSDLKVRLTRSAKVHLSGQVLPSAIDPIDYSNLVVEIFRRRENETLPKLYKYYRLNTLSMNEQSGYFLFTDTVANLAAEVVNNEDVVPDPLDSEVSSTRLRPPSANFLTAINNQLVAGSFSGEKKASVKITGSATYSAFQTKEFIVETLQSGEVDFYVCADSNKAAVNSAATSAGVSFTLTVTDASGITAGDVILITRASASALTYRPTLIGWWTVSAKTITPSHTITVNWSKAPSSLTTADTASLVYYHKAGKIPLVSDLSFAPISGSVQADLTIAAGLSLHLSQAITRTLLAEGIYAFGGKDQVGNALTVVGANLVDITVPDMTNLGATIYCNDRLGTFTAMASSESYGSRVAFSVPGYPEVFDSIDVASGSTDLPLVHDINPDNGEEVTAALPFFGVSAFGSAQQSDVLLVFKKRGGYLLSPQAKLSRSAAMQELSVLGGNGCESALSPVASQLGVFFTNTTGIYLISKDFQLIRIGQALKGFKDKLLANFTEVAGCNDVSEGRLLFTDSSGITFTFQLPDSAEMPAGWVRYDAIPATMWAHREGKAVFASSGFVGSFGAGRFADAGEAIDTSILFRNLDAGFATLKKVCSHISVLMSADYDYETDEITVSTSSDFTPQFDDCDLVKLAGTTASLYDGLSDLTHPSLKMIQFSPAVSKAGWYQLKVETSKLDADFRVSQVVYKMALLRSRADVQAGETT